MDLCFLASSVFWINAFKMTSNSFLTLHSMLLLFSRVLNTLLFILSHWSPCTSQRSARQLNVHRGGMESRLCDGEWSSSRHAESSWSAVQTLVIFLATSPVPSRTGKIPGKPNLLDHLPWANVELTSEQRNHSWGHTSDSCLALTSDFFLSR